MKDVFNMEEKQELNLTDEQLEEIVGGLNKQDIKDATGKVIKFGKENIEKILLAILACASTGFLIHSAKKYKDSRKANDDIFYN